MSTQLPLPTQHSRDNYVLGVSVALVLLCAVIVDVSTPRTASAWPISHTTDHVCPAGTHPTLVAGGAVDGTKQWYVICRPTAEVCANLDKNALNGTHF